MNHITRHTTMCILIFLAVLPLAAQSSATNEVANTATGEYALESLISLALENAPEIDAAFWAYSAAEGARDQAFSAFGPRLGYQGSYTYITNPTELELAAGSFATTPLMIPDEDVSFAMSGNHYFTAGFALEQTLTTWGKLWASYHAAQAGVRAAAAAADGQMLQIEAEVRMLYEVISHNRAMLLFLGEGQVAASRLLEISESAYATGFVIRADVLASRSAIQALDLQKKAAEQRIDEALYRLSQITGVGVEDLTDQLQNQQLENFWGNSFFGDEYVSSLPGYQTHPDITLGETPTLRQVGGERDQARERSLAASIARRPLPDIALRIEAGYESDTIPFSEDSWLEDGFNVQATIGLSGNIFTSGANQSAYRMAEAGAAAAQARYEAVADQLEREIYRLTLQLEYDISAVEYSAAVLDEKRQRRELLEQQYATGAVTESELLQMKLEEISAGLELLGGGLQYYSDWTQLMVLNGGWE